ncbi:hypothetical protein KY339_02375, partial [Candidatus Woesearchaeota archaeon]|nr:hypothetical protein [Candidatus Woesearchaeota archaeon]
MILHGIGESNPLLEKIVKTEERKGIISSKHPGRVAAGIISLMLAIQPVVLAQEKKEPPKQEKETEIEQEDDPLALVELVQPLEEIVVPTNPVKGFYNPKKGVFNGPGFQLRKDKLSFKKKAKTRILNKQPFYDEFSGNYFFAFKEKRKFGFIRFKLDRKGEIKYVTSLGEGSLGLVDQANCIFSENYHKKMLKVNNRLAFNPKTKKFVRIIKKADDRTKSIGALTKDVLKTNQTTKVQIAAYQARANQDRWDNIEPLTYNFVFDNVVGEKMIHSELYGEKISDLMKELGILLAADENGIRSTKEINYVLPGGSAALSYKNSFRLIDNLTELINLDKKKAKEGLRNLAGLLKKKFDVVEEVRKAAEKTKIEDYENLNDVVKDILGDVRPYLVWGHSEAAKEIYDGIIKDLNTALYLTYGPNKLMFEAGGDGELASCPRVVKYQEKKYDLEKHPKWLSYKTGLSIAVNKEMQSPSIDENKVRDTYVKYVKNQGMPIHKDLN